MNTTHQEHRSNDGRYTYSHFEHLCVCGHRLGDHLAGSRKGQAGECVVHEGPHGNFDQPCSCEKFKKARVRR